MRAALGWIVDGFAGVEAVSTPVMDWYILDYSEGTNCNVIVLIRSRKARRTQGDYLDAAIVSRINACGAESQCDIKFSSLHRF